MFPIPMGAWGASAWCRRNSNPEQCEEAECELTLPESPESVDCVDRCLYQVVEPGKEAGLTGLPSAGSGLRLLS